VQLSVLIEPVDFTVCVLQNVEVECACLFASGQDGTEQVECCIPQFRRLVCKGTPIPTTLDTLTQLSISHVGHKEIVANMNKLALHVVAGVKLAKL
jgi:hypothetical protein